MADTLDILSLEEARAAINSSAVTKANLPAMVTAVSRVIDSLCGPVVVRTVTAELHAGGSCVVHLRRRPVTSITTVREAQGPGNIVTLSAVAWGGATDGYFAPASVDDPTLKSGELYRKSAGADYPWHEGSHAVEVTYIAGRYATTSTVDERFKQAASSVLARLWKREAGTWAQSPTFLETSEAQPTGAFFRAVRPIVEELLVDELQLSAAGFA